MATIKTTIKSTELGKGTRVRLANGWYATLVDNTKRQNTRVADVEGFVREMGSVYAHDIQIACIDGVWVPVEHTPAQNKMRQAVANW